MAFITVSRLVSIGIILVADGNVHRFCDIGKLGENEGEI